MADCPVFWRRQLDDVRRILRVCGVGQVLEMAQSHRSLPESLRSYWSHVLTDGGTGVHPETVAPATDHALRAYGTTL